MNEYKAHPLRVQRKRTKGYKLPPDAVVVTRPTQWGNPYTVETFGLELSLLLFRNSVGGVFDPTPLKAHSDAVFQVALLAHKDWLRRFVGIAPKQLARMQLRGKKLACFCPLDRPCHADVLCELANS